MKITKRCDSTTLVNCFPTKFKAGTEDIDTTTLATGTKLGTNNIAGNTIGLMLANGTSILFTLRDSAKVAGACDRIDPVDNTSATTGCLSFLYDVNGYGSPNVIGKDIGTVNATISTCDGSRLGALCVDAADLVLGSTYDPPVSTVEYQAMLTSGLIPHFFGDDINRYNQDYWAGAINACNAKGMRLPTRAEHAVLYNNVQNQGNTIGAMGTAYWTADEYSSWDAWYYQYNSSGYASHGFKNEQPSVRCVK